MWRLRLALVALFLPWVARAEPALEAHAHEDRPCGKGFAWVLVKTQGLATRFEAAVLTQLRAGLRGERLDACSSGAGSSRASSAVLSLHRDARGLVTIDVRDAHHTLRRRIDLLRVPADGRALALAVAADELIRATLAEQPAVSHAPEPEAQKPPRAPEVSRQLRPRTRHTALAASFASERYVGGQRTLGIDAGVRQALTERWYARFVFGARKLERVRTAHGEITGTMLGGEIGAGFALLRLDPLSVCAELSIWGARAALKGKPVDGAIGSDAAGLFAVARTGMALEVRPAPWLGLELRGGVGAPLRALRIDDSGETKTAISGLEVYGSFGPGWVF